MQTLTLESGAQVSWDVRGEGSPVILMHGTPWSSWTWEQAAADLANTHRVFTWDMPGYGQSSKDPDHPVDLTSQSATFVEVLGHWGLATDKATIVAHDIGGAVALGAHLLHGIDFGRLLLVDTVVRRPWGSPLYRLVQDHHAVFTQLPPNMHRALVREYIAGAFSAPSTDATLDRLVEPWLGDEGQPAFYRQIHQVRPEQTDPLEAKLAEVRCPVDVLWGADDTWLPLDQGKELAEVIGAGQFTVQQQAGHLIQVEQPQAVIDWIADRLL